MRKDINLLWNAILHSLLFGTLLNLFIAILVALATSGVVGLIFFVPLSFIVGLASVFVNPLLLCILVESSLISSSSKTLRQFVFTLIGAAFGAIFGAMIMFGLVEGDKMLGGMVDTLTHASSAITAISYGITNYQFARWYQNNMP